MKNRIDKELVERQLITSRTRAQELIESGYVKCNDKIIYKCNYLVSESDKLEIIKNDKLKYVSRGGLKLEKAINEFDINLKNKIIMDIGSSTGGFCDCALQIIAVDVGTNLMHEMLRNNPKIELHEKTNFKNLPHNYFVDIDVITCDVSFISLKQIIKKIYNENIRVDLICLIKPQFECGKELADKYKGIILNKSIHKQLIKDLFYYFNSLNFYVKNFTFSPIKGGDGNIEYLVQLSNKNCTNKEVNIDRIVDIAFKS